MTNQLKHRYNGLDAPALDRLSSEQANGILLELAKVTVYQADQVYGAVVLADDVADILRCRVSPTRRHV